MCLGEASGGNGKVLGAAGTNENSPGPEFRDHKLTGPTMFGLACSAILFSTRTNHSVGIWLTPGRAFSLRY